MKVLGIAIVVLGALVFLYNRWIRFSLGTEADKIIEKIQKNRGKSDPRALEDPKNGALVANDVGFRIVTPRGGATDLVWNEIEEIHAFKKDLITTDMIYLAFKVFGKEGHYQMHEEMAGYYDLLQAMQNYLPEFTLEWVLDFPPFATNPRIIWRRAALATA